MPGDTSFLVSPGEARAFPNIDDESARGATAQFLPARPTESRKRITAAAAAALAVTAGTFASFSDAEAAPNQSIAAGTLDLVPGGSAVTDPINNTNAMPADAGAGYKRLDLRNAGSLPDTLTLNVDKVADKDNGCNEPETVDEPNCAADDLGELDDKLIVVILDSDQSKYPGSKYLNAWSGQTVNLGTLAAGTTKTVYISTQVDPSADNRVQSDSASFVVKADLKQS